MALPKALCDREQDKFRLGADDRTVVAVSGGQIEATAQLIVSSQSLASDFDTSSIDVSGFNLGTIVASWIGANGTDATFVLEISDDGTVWQQLGESGTSFNGDIPDSEQIWQITVFTARFLRVKFTANANTTGTTAISFIGRS